MSAYANALRSTLTNALAAAGLSVNSCGQFPAEGRALLTCCVTRPLQSIPLGHGESAIPVGTQSVLYEADLGDPVVDGEGILPLDAPGLARMTLRHATPFPTADGAQEAYFAACAQSFEVFERARQKQHKTTRPQR